jgi:hypothetical protein
VPRTWLIPTFRRKVLSPPCALNSADTNLSEKHTVYIFSLEVETECFSETLVSTCEYRPPRRQIPEQQRQKQPYL